MRLKVFKKERTYAGAGLLRTLSVRRKAHNVTLSSLFVKQVGIKSDDTTFAVLALDEDSKNDWYIAIGNFTDGFKVNKKTNKTSNKTYGVSYYFCCGDTANVFLDAAKCKNYGMFLVSEKPQEIDGVKWWKIITSKPVRTK